MVSITAKIYSKKILTPPYEWHKNITPRWLYRRCLSHRRVWFRSILFTGESAITVHNAVIWFMKEKMGGRKSWNTVSFGKYFFLRGQRTNLTFRNPCELVSQRGEDEPPPEDYDDLKRRIQTRSISCGGAGSVFTQPDCPGGARQTAQSRLRFL